MERRALLLLHTSLYKPNLGRFIILDHVMVICWTFLYLPVICGLILDILFVFVAMVNVYVLFFLVVLLCSLLLHLSHCLM